MYHMRGTPPPPGRSGSGANWGLNNDQRPDQTVGAAYRNGPMAPGPRPMGPAGQGVPLSRPLGGDPSRTYTPSRPHPGATMAGSLARSSRPMGAVAVPIAPPEHLFAGNPRRLWLAEMASTAGDAVLGAGLVIWYFDLTYRMSSVALLLILLAAPAVLVNLFAGYLGGIRDPRNALRMLGILRAALALLFVVFVYVHFHPLVPVILLLACGLSLATNLRGALRRGAIANGVPLRARGMLASGDQAAAGILAVAGPALATLLYILNDERVIAIAVGAAVCYLIAAASESQAEPLPDKILFQRATADEPEVVSVWDNDEDEDNSRVVKAEAVAQVWELAAPATRGAAMADVDDGIRIAGTSSHAITAFIVLALLAGVGGTLAVIEPFFVWRTLEQPPFVLGLLFTATGLGAAIASAIVVELRAAGRLFCIVGLLGSGAGLWYLPNVHDVPHALGVVALIGAANIFAIRGGQMTLLRHFVPTGQRAVAASSAVFKALATVIGLAMGFALADGLTVGHSHLVTALGMENTLKAGGIGIVLAGIITAVFLVLPNRMAPTLTELAPLPDDEWDDDDEYDDEDSAEYSRYRPAYRGDSRMSAAYSAQYPAASAEYEAPRGRGRRDAEDDWDAPPQRRR